jgi:hypothetical protein
VERPWRIDSQETENLARCLDLQKDPLEPVRIRLLAVPGQPTMKTEVHRKRVGERF